MSKAKTKKNTIWRQISWKFSFLHFDYYFIYVIISDGYWLSESDYSSSISSEFIF